MKSEAAKIIRVNDKDANYFRHDPGREIEKELKVTVIAVNFPADMPRKVFGSGSNVVKHCKEDNNPVRYKQHHRMPKAETWH